MALAVWREQQRIAHLLHDDVQQMLYAALTTTSILRESLAAREDALVQADWERLQRLLETAVETIRTLSVELSPPDSRSSLNAALRFLAQHMKELHQLDVDLQINAKPAGLSEELTAFIFQIVRELLFNVVKHAQVSKALVIVIEQGDYINIAVFDQGVGFSAPVQCDNPHRQGGFGLAHIRQQVEALGGVLETNAARGRGSSIHITLPRQINETEENVWLRDEFLL